MKNLFEINEEEKSRIINLHESATKKQYLTEDADTFGKKYGLQEINAGSIVYTLDKILDPRIDSELMLKSANKNLLSAWTELNRNSFLPSKIKKLFSEAGNILSSDGVVPDSILGKIGSYLINNPDAQTQINNYIRTIQSQKQSGV